MFTTSRTSSPRLRNLSTCRVAEGKGTAPRAGRRRSAAATVAFFLLPELSPVDGGTLRDNEVDTIFFAAAIIGGDLGRRHATRREGLRIGAITARFGKSGAFSR